MRPPPEEKRWAAVLTYKKTKSIAAAAKAAGLGYKQAKRWVQRYLGTGSVQELPRAGRPHALGAAAAHKAEVLLLSNKHGGTRGVAHVLLARGLTKALTHRTTVSRAAREAARVEGHPITTSRTAPRKALSPQHMRMRLAFAEANKKRPWGNVMFVDRKKFMFRYPGTQVNAVTWHEVGQKPEVPRAGHPLALNVYMGITPEGSTSCFIVAGTHKHVSEYTTKQGRPARNITAQAYKVCVEKVFVKEGRELMKKAGITHWVLCQDGDPTHRGTDAVLKQLSRGYAGSVTLLKNWPPNSPDLNPIENVWGWAQAKVDALGCKTWPQFKQAVLSTLKGLTKQQLAKYYQSMPTRMRDCIRLQGGKTRH